MADINEKVTVETDKAVGNLGDLKKASQDADEWLDNVIDRARKLDDEEVSVPVETPGAVQASEELDKVDTSARKAGDGAKVGVSGISDLTGPLGNASGAAGELGQSMEAVSGIAESMAAKMGLSEEATGKLTAVLGGAATAVAIGAAAWSLYKDEQARVKKGLDETRDALGKVYDKLREGDAQAAAETFVDTMGEKIEGFKGLIGDVSKADIAGAIFGDTASIDNIKRAIEGLDGTTRVLAEGALVGLQQSWGDAKNALQENIDLTAKVEGFFGTTGAAADLAKKPVENLNQAYLNLAATLLAAAGGPVLPPGASWDVQANPASTLNFDPAKFAAAANGGQVVNYFPPANTPLAVDKAVTEQARIQGPR